MPPRPPTSPAVGTPFPEVAVPATLVKPDPLVRALRDALRGKSFEHYGRLCVHDPSLPTVQVHRENVPRALRLVDATVKAARKLGYEFKVHEAYQQRSLHLVVEGEPVQFGVWEKSRQERIPPPKGAPRWDTGRLVYHSTGQISLGLGHKYSAPYRRLLGDTARIRAEDRVGEFLVGVHAEASMQRAERERIHQAQLEREREAEAVRAREREWDIEKARREALVAQADALATSRRVSAFVDEVEHRATVAILSDEETEALSGWVQWAREHAGRLDPLADGLPPWPAPIPVAPAPWWSR